MCYIENLLGIKARGEAETDYRFHINTYMGNIYNLILQADISDIKINKELTICLYHERTTFDNCMRLDARIIPDGDESAMQQGSVFLNSNTQIVYEYVKDSASLNLDNGVDLANKLLEQSSVSLTKDQLGETRILEFRAALRSIPIEIQLNVDYDDFIKDPEDTMEYFLAEGTDFNVRITNIGDQIEKGIQVVLLPPVELDIVPDSISLHTYETKDDLTHDIFKEGMYFQELRPGDSINIGFQLRLSDRVSFSEEVLSLASIQNFVHVRTASAGYKYCDLYMQPVFFEDHVFSVEGLFDCPSEDVLDSYCPGRKMFEYQEKPDIPSLNTIKNHPILSDERQFIYLRNYDRSEQFMTQKEVNPGDVLEVIVFFHNPYRERSLFESIICVDLPHRVVREEDASITAKIKQERSNPSSIWSEVKLHTKEDIRLEVANDLVVLYGSTINSGEPIDPKQLFETGWTIDEGLGYKIKFVKSDTLGYVLFRICIVSA